MKKFSVFVPIIVIAVILSATFSPAIATANSINNKILRLHILANSDSPYDQDIKLELRDYFLGNTSDLFNGKTIDDNIKIANENLDKLQALCNTYLEKYNLAANIEVTKEYFKTRVYDDYTLPAGIYNSIKITIGEGRGHNWWCIVFPAVCISACSDTMQSYLTPEEMKLIESGYTPKFKVIEIYQRITNG